VALLLSKFKFNVSVTKQNHDARSQKTREVNLYVKSFLFHEIINMLLFKSDMINDLLSTNLSSSIAQLDGEELSLDSNCKER
jgi:hypothetical protein